MKIFRKISYSDVAKLAAHLEIEKRRETEAGLEALVHVVQNRIFSGEHFGNILTEFNFDLSGSDDLPASFDVLSLIAKVFDGKSEDPTEGAVRCHRHEVLPEWAKNLQPTALIGGRFYYV